MKIETNLPPAEVSPNARVSWRKKALATSLWRQECAVLIRAIAIKAPRKLVPPVTLSLEFFCGRSMLGGNQVDDGRYRPRDIDNAVASCKALIDAIVDAGVIESDSAEYLRLGSVQIHKHNPSGGKMPQKIVVRLADSETGPEGADGE